MVIRSLRSLKSVKPNWMEDVEGVNCLLKKFTFNCHLVVNCLTPFHFLSKQLTPSTSSIQLGLTLF